MADTTLAELLPQQVCLDALEFGIPPIVGMVFAGGGGVGDVESTVAVTAVIVADATATYTTAAAMVVFCGYRHRSHCRPLLSFQSESRSMAVGRLGSDEALARVRRGYRTPWYSFLCGSHKKDC